MDAEVRGDKQPECKECAGSGSPTSYRRESDSSSEEQGVGHETPVRQPTVLTLSDDVGGRRKVARILNWATASIAARAHSQYEKTGFKRDQRSNYPETPGEDWRNPRLRAQRAQYRESSRAASFVSSRGSSDNGEGSSRSARSPNRRHESYPISSPSPARSCHRRDHSGSLPSNGLLDSSHFFGPPSPETLSRDWPRGLSPFNRRTPSRSRADSGSETAISPTTISSPSFAHNPPKIVISSVVTD